VRAAWLAILAGAVACRSPAAPHAPTTSPAARSPLDDHALELRHLVGSWRWMLKTDDADTSRVETETWQLAPSPTSPTQLVGRYVRDVEIRSINRVPFTCNQRPWYRQRAIYDVTLVEDAGELAIHETGYHTEPGPCDHGFRHMADYTGRLAGDRLVLRWTENGGGEQTLWQTSDATAPLPDAPWPSTVELAGPWRWEASSFDATGNIQDEAEQWELSRRPDGRLDASYRRHVTVRSPDGTNLACANAPSWSFDDTYVLTGAAEEQHWRFVEVAVDPGDHPCLRATPKRNLDEATAEQLGDFLVLEWRGKRRQVLYRPD
jgi:hypothetical protein